MLPRPDYLSLGAPQMELYTFDAQGASIQCLPWMLPGGAVRSEALPPPPGLSPPWPSCLRTPSTHKVKQAKGYSASLVHSRAHVPPIPGRHAVPKW